MRGPFHGAPEHGKPLAGKLVGDILPCERLLDIGPGIRPYQHFKAPTHLCVEPHWEYMKELTTQGYPVILSDALTVLPSLWNFEVILFLDVLEHMDKVYGQHCINHASALATRQVVVFTPLGFVKQEQIEGEPDPWGYQGWKWQTHRSGWTPDDFKGWDVFVDKTYHGGHGAFSAVLNK